MLLSDQYLNNLDKIGTLFVCTLIKQETPDIEFW